MSRRRRRPTSRPYFSGPVLTATLFSLAILCSAPLRAPAAAIPQCSDAGAGWCLARRFSGDTPGGELGFRFGEPLDVDGDGKADPAAGARFKLQGTFENGTAIVWSGATGARIREWDGTMPDGLFGQSVVPIPDLGDDGVADVIVAAPNAVTDGLVRGFVVARSPKTGEEIWKRSSTREENLGWDLALAGDQDGDGRSDVFAGAPSGIGGRAYLLSGKDGATLRVYAPPKDVVTFGWYVALLDDLDADGHGDLVVGAQYEKDAQGLVVGGAYVFSSATGKQLYHWNGANLSSFGEVVARVGDLDADGKGEIVVASPGKHDRTRIRTGEVDIYSGATGKPLRHWSGSQGGELFGRMVVSVGDLDGDGAEDLAIGAPWHRREPADRVGRVELRSGRSGAVLAEFFGDEADCWFGWHIRRAPDPDGLGRPALLISSLRHPVDGHAAVGVLDLYVLRREKSSP